ncbi:hypothetical protein ACFSKM_16670 [Ancylobacter dichloromethanicus]
MAQARLPGAVPDAGDEMAEFLADRRFGPESRRGERAGGGARSVDAQHHLPMRRETVAGDVNRHLGLGRGGALEHRVAVDLEAQRDRPEQVVAIEAPDDALSALDEHAAERAPAVLYL